MAYNFRECDRDQLFLFPPSMREWLPKDHLVWFILDAVDQLDLSPFLRRYRADGWGRAAYPPRMMVALLVYAYCSGVRSSRKIERACQENIAFRVITGGQVPDHTTIARFRQYFQEELAELFTEVLWLCGRAGLVKVGTVVVDGTKIAGNASLSRNRTYKHLEEEVARMLREAEEADAAEEGMEGEGGIPGELADREKRLEKLRRAKEELERLAEEEAAERERELREEGEGSGKRKRGRKPKPPDPRPDPGAKVNLTDPESRIMKTRRGYVQGYNAQLVVTVDQIIVAAEVTQDQNDVRQLHPMLKRTEEELERAGIGKKPKVAVADAGYFSEKNITGAGEDGPELVVAPCGEERLRRKLVEEGPPRGRIPQGLSAKELMERKLLTKRGRERYGLRKVTVEPVVGQLKALGDRFLRRGLKAVRSEFRLLCACNNLLKLWRAVKAGIARWVGSWDPLPQVG